MMTGLALVLLCSFHLFLQAWGIAAVARGREVLTLPITTPQNPVPSAFASRREHDRRRGRRAAATSTSTKKTTMTSSTTIKFTTTTTSKKTSVSAASTSSSGKYVFAHFMVGNTYPYAQTDWANDIALASSRGIDAFALNVGSDSWQPDRVSSAFAAAKASGTGFKLFLSFDMSSLPCASLSDASVLQQYIRTYTNHPNQMYLNGKLLVSTFAGESCYFGQSSVNAGWTAAIKSPSGIAATWFIPSFFVDPGTFRNYPVMDGAFNWNGGWPMTNSDVTFASDNNYISNLGGRMYMAAVSPWFFTHYGVNSYNKNWIYRADDWLFASKWEEIIANRNSIGLAEVISYNDYGESHYIGPIEGAQPNSQAWVNGFPHTGWLALSQYYSQAYKTGSYPTITSNKIYLWARPHPAAATASNDPVGRPTNYQWTNDYLWAIVFTNVTGKLTLSIGSSTSTTTVQSGVTKLKLPLSAGSPRAVLINSQTGAKLFDFSPTGYQYVTNPTTYNFNAFVASSS